MGEHNVFNRRQNDQRIAQLEKEIERYRTTCDELRQKIKALETDEDLERIAREKYQMHGDSEEVYIFK